ncbi:ATP-binding protein [Hydrotalea sp.]|uniref:sensor histidine kinase n=1 Tax=Hydrotalea sp. TaxID=2881279 RepID=UPI0026089F23|nr:ATP-binding protein [Hydrotalea sp.]
MKKIYFIYLFLIVRFVSFAQTREVDSLQNALQYLPNDTAKVNRMNDIIGKLQFLNPEKAAELAWQSILLAKKTNYKLGLSIAYRLRGVLYVDKAITDSGKFFYDKAYSIVKNEKDKLFIKQKGLLTHNYGVLYHQRQLYDSATIQYLEAANIFKSIHEEGLFFFPYINLATIYSFLNDNEHALQYAKEANKAAVKLNDPGKTIIAINQEMSIHLALKQFDSVLIPLKKNVALAHTLQNNYGEGKTYNLIGKYFSEGKQQFDSSINNRKKALELMEKIHNQYEIIATMEEIGFDYMQKGAYTEAKAYLTKSIDLARKSGLDQITKYGLENMVIVEEKLGNLPQAFSYLKEFTILKDSLDARSNRNYLYELEAKYQNTNKELQISQLEAEKKLQQLELQQNKIWNYILIGASITFFIIGALSYRNYKHKQALQQQRIIELETQQQLAAAEAVLKGEEQERTRLAKDLHDGLGGMLSGIKYTMSHMKQNLIMTPENQQAFERSIDMLDSSINEMRRVAHNMMPEALLKFGLDAALKDLCQQTNKTGALQIKYQSIGIQDKLFGQTIAINMYRIAQELINNILKHAAAQQAIVQISYDAPIIHITVEDDGKGMPENAYHYAKGMGWNNIRSRIEYLKGKVNIQSAPEKGTSIHIELKV